MLVTPSGRDIQAVEMCLTVDVALTSSFITPRLDSRNVVEICKPLPTKRDRSYLAFECVRAPNTTVWRKCDRLAGRSTRPSLTLATHGCISKPVIRFITRKTTEKIQLHPLKFKMSKFWITITRKN